MLYFLIILLSMFFIFLVNIIFFMPTYGFSPFYAFCSVVILTVSVILIDGIFAFIVRWLLPKNWFNENRKIFVAKNSECKFYEHLKIKKWKDKVLELGCFTSFSKSKIVKPKDPEYLKQFIIESNYGIVCHIVGIITGYSIIFIHPLKYAFLFGFPVATVNAVLNLLPVFILRYNLNKLHVLNKFFSQKALVK